MKRALGLFAPCVARVVAVASRGPGAPADLFAGTLADLSHAYDGQTGARTLGTDERGAEAVAGLHFPGLRPDAARWLVGERRVRAVGLDTPSIDYGQSKLFESHRVLFERDVPAFENLANLERLPGRGFHVVALPMKIKGGSGGPLRAVAVVRND